MGRKKKQATSKASIVAKLNSAALRRERKTNWDAEVEGKQQVRKTQHVAKYVEIMSAGDREEYLRRLALLQTTPVDQLESIPSPIVVAPWHPQWKRCVANQPKLSLTHMYLWWLYWLPRVNPKRHLYPNYRLDTYESLQDWQLLSHYEEMLPEAIEHAKTVFMDCVSTLQKQPLRAFSIPFRLAVNYLHEEYQKDPNAWFWPFFQLCFAKVIHRCRIMSDDGQGSHEQKVYHMITYLKWLFARENRNDLYEPLMTSMYRAMDGYEEFYTKRNVDAYHLMLACCYFSNSKILDSMMFQEHKMPDERCYNMWLYASRSLNPLLIWETKHGRDMIHQYSSQEYLMIDEKKDWRTYHWNIENVHHGFMTSTEWDIERDTLKKLQSHKESHLARPPCSCPVQFYNGLTHSHIYQNVARVQFNLQAIVFVQSFCRNRSELGAISAENDSFSEKRFPVPLEQLIYDYLIGGQHFPEIAFVC